jgi:hypothetical protein
VFELFFRLEGIPSRRMTGLRYARNDKSMMLSIIIVSWNVKEKLRKNLEALYKSEGDFSFEVFVVDNNSGDGSAEMVRMEFPNVRLIANSENLGFAKANNQAMLKSQGEFILLLNPDMQVFPDTLKSMLGWVQNNESAVVSSCRLIDEKGGDIKLVRRFPRLCDQLMIILKIPHILPMVLNKYLMANFNYEKAAVVDSIRGAFFLINKFKYQRITGNNLPLLDERYFLWFEEVDLCRQIKVAGGEIWYAPAARCLDYVGASFSQVKRGQTQKYFRDSMLKYFKKWESRWQYYILKSAWSLVTLIVR